MANRGNEQLSIGQLAQRTGLAVSAIRYYEAQGLLTASRNAGGQRRFARSCIRRLSFVLIAQQLGYPLQKIRHLLASLPAERTPTQRDWAKMSKTFRQSLDERIDTLVRLRDRLDGCIGCGCLSLTNCALYNADDKAATLGTGPRFVVAERPKGF